MAESIRSEPSDAPSPRARPFAGEYRHLRVAYVFLGLAFLAGAVAQSIATFA